MLPPACMSVEPIVERISESPPLPLGATPTERPLVELKNVAASYFDDDGSKVDVARDLNELAALLADREKQR